MAKKNSKSIGTQAREMANDMFTVMAEMLQRYGVERFSILFDAGMWYVYIGGAGDVQFDSCDRSPAAAFEQAVAKLIKHRRAEGLTHGAEHN